MMRRAAAASPVMKLLNRIREQRVADAVIADPDEHTVMDAQGAVRSVQAASVTMAEADLDAIWTPMHLERLARTYWKFLSRVSLGLIRVRYTDDDRAVVFLTRPFVLLRFHPPEYELTGERGVVRWRIRNGILVAEPDHGHLEIEVRRAPSGIPGRARVHVEVEVANFYPALSVWVARWFYAQTQSRIHVLVTHGFLRSLARLELEESAVGRFAIATGNGDAREHEPQPPVTVGDTPWPLVIGLGVAAGLAAALAFLRFREPERWPASARILARSWRDWIRRTVPERLRMTSDSVLAPRVPS
jgi:hypothetical protein